MSFKQNTHTNTCECERGNEEEEEEKAGTNANKQISRARAINTRYSFACEFYKIVVVVVVHVVNSTFT